MAIRQMGLGRQAAPLSPPPPDMPGLGSMDFAQDPLSLIPGGGLGGATPTPSADMYPGGLTPDLPFGYPQDADTKRPGMLDYLVQEAGLGEPVSNKKAALQQEAARRANAQAQDSLTTLRLMDPEDPKYDDALQFLKGRTGEIMSLKGDPTETVALMGSLEQAVAAGDNERIDAVRNVFQKTAKQYQSNGMFLPTDDPDINRLTGYETYTTQEAEGNLAKTNSERLRIEEQTKLYASQREKTAAEILKIQEEETKPTGAEERLSYIRKLSGTEKGRKELDFLYPDTWNAQLAADESFRKKTKAQQDEVLAEEKKALRKTAAFASSGHVFAAIEDAEELAEGWASTGAIGAGLSWMPQTDAYTLDKKLLTIKANIGFDRLQEMRSMSPTGGALGQVAVQELTALQSTIASLEPGMGEEELKKGLTRVKNHYMKWLQAIDPEAAAAISLENKKSTRRMVFDAQGNLISDTHGS